MSLLDHAWATHRKYSLRSCIQHGYGHPQGNRSAHDPNYPYETTNKERLLITTARHDPGSSRSEHLSSGKFFKTPPKEEPGSSKQIGKAFTLSLKQAKAGLIIYKS
ncbi:hypothetical protein CK203_055232 [Vitis vinifera]|uniref:Uncharacterized protein n=1 Tax=Vitis vinifera TaxID=29760 RepID=A0A438GTZ1_VITVI|nr:hypothetical protein CK203_055232 [Vitis vinifera]